MHSYDPDSACDYEVNCLTLIAKILQQRESWTDGLTKYLALFTQLVFLSGCLSLLYFIYRLRRLIQNNVLGGINWFALISDLIRASRLLHEQAERSPTVGVHHPTGELQRYVSPDVCVDFNNTSCARDREYMVQYAKRDTCSTSSSITVFALEPTANHLDDELNTGVTQQITVPMCTSSSHCHNCGNVEAI